MDRYLVHGPEYKAVRDAVARAVLERQPLAIRPALEVGGAAAALCRAHLRLPLLVSKDALGGVPEGDTCVRNTQTPAGPADVPLARSWPCDALAEPAAAAACRILRGQACWSVHLCRPGRARLREDAGLSRLHAHTHAGPTGSGPGVSRMTFLRLTDGRPCLLRPAGTQRRSGRSACSWRCTGRWPLCTAPAAQACALSRR